MGKRIVLLQVLTAMPGELATVLAGVDKSSSRIQAEANGWSVADVVQHLLLVEERFQERLQRVVAEERPFLPTIHPSPSEHTRTEPLADLVAEFTQLREQTIAYLTSLKAKSWEKTAVHETEGPVTFHFLVQMIIDHDSDHLSQLQTLSQSLIPNPQ